MCCFSMALLVVRVPYFRDMVERTLAALIPVGPGVSLTIGYTKPGKPDQERLHPFGSSA